ncbi:MAG: hypothetical protein NTV70_03430 [Acidobacteria bacterium]|nr:hypothetical protein [Acidobacteriota bacterium]
MTWNKSTTRGNGSGAATAPTRTPAAVRNVVAEAAQESALRRQEIQALLEEYARKQEESAAAAPAAPAPVSAAAPKSSTGTAAAAAPAPRPSAPKAANPTTPASIDRRLHALETSINRIEAKLSGGVKADKVDEIATILEDLLTRVRGLRG